jgi:two-component system response regulator HydG
MSAFKSSRRATDGGEGSRAVAPAPPRRYVSLCNMVEQCDAPFSRAPRLCPVCRLAPDVGGLRRCSRVVAESAAMRALLTRAAPIAAAGAAPVILRGETGSGKEVVARTLHANSPRRGRPFVAINVAALPAELLESELFGHVKGAFTGAVASKAGLFEAADGGTLFLDEIAEMPAALQAKLLRALQDGELRRVGDTRAFAVDVRILCATHRDLADAVERRAFREDLYYRLKVFTLEVPPLRERRADILPLARLFAARHGAATPRFTPAACAALEGWRWPGNVRELENAVQHGVVLAGGGDIDVAHLPDELRERRPARPRARPLRTLAEAERDHILEVLEACGGNQIRAAEVLGIGRTTLWRKLRAP